MPISTALWAAASLAIFGTVTLPLPANANAGTITANPVPRAAPAELQGKTREQVRHEVVQAWYDGTLQSVANNSDYPPSAATIERSRLQRAKYVFPGTAPE